MEFRGALLLRVSQMTELRNQIKVKPVLNLFLWGWVLAILFYLYGLRVILGNVLKFVREARRQNIAHAVAR